MEAKNILLIEDNPNDALLTMRACKKSGLGNEVVVARDGAEALEHLFVRGRRAGRGAWSETGLVLLDLRLPKVDGLEVLRRLREDDRTRDLPVVVLTSSKEDRSLVENEGLRADAYLRKLAEFDRMAETARRLWGRRQRHGEQGPRGEET